ncbi:hypothetical protein K3495_g8196 [Podosphaera aphanis]|nr:hypothetical protein K3495_g8196 [Podosphaera aphanis]
MAKEKSINPVQAQRKAEKVKAIKKSKAEVASRRNEKLARRNPNRIQKQLDELEAIESSGGKLTNHEKNLRQTLEKELRAVRKAQETLGESAVRSGGFSKTNASRGGEKGDATLGKRKRDNFESSDDESDVPEDVKRIPMPRDTPPPISKEVLDRWYQKKRERAAQNSANAATNANKTPLGGVDRGIQLTTDSDNTTAAPKVESQTVYEAKPVIRNLRKEAVAFVPVAVRVKLDKVKGIGSLIEPEEAEELEKEGYLGHGQSGPAG